MRVLDRDPHGPGPLHGRGQDPRVRVRKVVELAPRQLPQSLQSGLGEHGCGQSAVAPEDEPRRYAAHPGAISAARPWLPDEDPQGMVRNRLDQGIRLALAASGEPLLRPPARRGPALDVAASGLGGHEGVLVSQPHGIPAASDEEDGERVVPEGLADCRAAGPVDPGERAVDEDPGAGVVGDEALQPTGEPGTRDLQPTQPRGPRRSGHRAVRRLRG